MEVYKLTIQAAGAVLWRRGLDRKVLIAVIHRPRYDDWSLPKGKLENNESPLSCAYREILEETGVSAIFGPELGEVVYEVDGLTKVVRYWSARASEVPYGQTDPDEVDAVQWLSVPDAKKKLTRGADSAIINVFTQFGPDTVALVLLRHAKAIRREDWDGDDGDRPLDNLGQRQAMRLLGVYFPYQLQEIHSSDAMRCLETVEPLARSLQMDIVISEDLSEYRHTSKSDAAFEYVQDLIESGNSALVCSHNPILPLTVRKLIGKRTFKKLDTKLAPGEAWVLHHRDGDIVAIDWVAAPVV